MIHKIVNGQAAIPEQIFLQPVKRYTRNLHIKAFQRPAGTKDCWVNLFFPNTIKDWNALPQYIINIQDTKIFKQELTKHYSTPQTE